MLVSVSFLKNTLGEEETIRRINNSNADLIHIDVMDGYFVQNKSTKYEELKHCFEGLDKPLDIHLMVKDTLKYVKEYISLKPKYLTFHIESTENVDEVIDYIKNNNVKVGIALRPETRIYDLIPYLDKIDMVLILGVTPGFGGQKFIKDVTSKIRELNALKTKYNYIISVDGGINDEVIKSFDTDIAVVGSFVTLSNNYNEAINKLKK